ELDVVHGGAGDVQALTAVAGDEVVIAVPFGDRQPLLVVAAGVRPEVELGAVGSGDGRDVPHLRLIVPGDDLVVAAARRLELPVLRVRTVARPLLDDGAVGGRASGGVHALAAV